VRRLVDDVVLVSDAEIAGAMRETLASAKLLAEGAAAASVAAVLTGRLPLAPGARVACVLSGGNVDLGVVSKVLTG
jgi:threonine dehydratase